MSRTTRFTAEVGLQLIDARAAGDTIEAAAAKSAIPTSTLYLWLEYGDRGIEPFVVFAARFRAAKLEADRAFVAEQVRLLNGGAALLATA
ncbi:MAG: hypothetical protein JWO85_571 [Candidatus Eremiobacteraeota bacterium]|nr:hypothetical protein [Candidatus Eremiobacteraeota bacterium]